MPLARVPGQFFTPSWAMPMVSGGIDGTAFLPSASLVRALLTHCQPGPFVPAGFPS